MHLAKKKGDYICSHASTNPQHHPKPHLVSMITSEHFEGRFCDLHVEHPLETFSTLYCCYNHSSCWYANAFLATNDTSIYRGIF